MQIYHGPFRSRIGVETAPNLAFAQIQNSRPPLTFHVVFLSMAINMKRRYSGDDSSQEPERKRSAQAYVPSLWCPGAHLLLVGSED